MNNRAGASAGRDPSYAAKRRTEMLKAMGKAFLIITIVLIVSGALLTAATIALLAHSGLLDRVESGGYYESAPIKSLTDVKGRVLSDGGNGKVSVQYGGHEYEDLDVLDAELMDWLQETGRSLQGVEVLFSTNEKGEITQIAMDSAPFLVLAEDAGRYTACRDQQIIRFTSEIPLKMNELYEGYFCYPDLRLILAEPAIIFVGAGMDPVCSGKQRVTEQDAYTGEEVELYQIRYDGNWYYCNQEIYDDLEEGDSLYDYTVYDQPPCITCP